MFSLLWLKKKGVADSGLSGAASSLCREAAAVSELLESDAVSVHLRTAPGPVVFLLECAGGSPGTVGCYFFFRLWIFSRLSS